MHHPRHHPEVLACAISISICICILPFISLFSLPLLHCYIIIIVCVHPTLKYPPLPLIDSLSLDPFSHFFRASSYNTPASTSSYNMAFLSHLNPIPSFPAYTGPYTVGTFDVEIPSSSLHSSTSTTDIPSTVAFRCFYPCEPNSKSPRSVKWVAGPQKQVINAYAQFLGAGQRGSSLLSNIMHLLYYISIPAIRNAPLLASPQSSKRWPVMVFSHGLGGSRNTYSHICGSLASHGVVVIAPDHRDGSSPIQYVRATTDTEAYAVEYQRYSHAPSRETYNGRDEQLKTRLAECSLIHEALLQIDAGEKLENLDPNQGKKNESQSTRDLLSMFHDHLDVHGPGSISWAGHSFGAATVVQFVKSVFYSPSTPSPILTMPPSSALKSQITPNTSVILLDLWGLPLTSPNTAALNRKPMPGLSPSGPGGNSILAILSEAFFKWRGNLSDVKRALSDPSSNEKGTRRPPANIFYPISSAHLSQSDFGVLFPTLTKYLMKADEPERTLRLNVRAILEVLRRSGTVVADTGDADLEKIVGETGTDGGEGDWMILSREEGVVRGWVALSADEDEAVTSRKAERAGVGRGVSKQETVGDGELNGAR